MTKKLGAIFFLALTVFLVYRFAIRYYFGEAREDAIDFPSYYHAAKLAFEFDKPPYSAGNWNIAEENYQNETGGGTLFPFLYPPPSLPFFGLFTRLEYESAKRLMLGLNHLMAFAFIPLFFFGILKLRPHDLLPIAGTFYLYNFFPLILTLYTGQINLLILLLTCLTWLGVKDKWHPFWIALPLALSIALKLYPVLFLVILFVRREYKTILFTIAILAIVSLASTPFLPHGIWQDWIENVASKGYLSDLPGVPAGRPANQSINALLVRAMFGLNVRFDPLITPPGWVAHILPYLLCGFVGLITTFAIWRAQSHENGVDMQFSIWLAAIFMIAPFSWDHHLVTLLPAIYAAFHEAFERRMYFALPILAGAAGFLALNFDFNNPFFREGWRTLLISAKLYAVAILWVFLAGIPFWKAAQSAKRQ